jgi:hypothetical protein
MTTKEHHKYIKDANKKYLGKEKMEVGQIEKCVHITV